VRDNHFNLLRLTASMMVLAGHSVVLSTGEEASRSAAMNAIASLAGIGVDCFFAISGYLVMGSLRRAPSLLAFAWRRAARIYPGLLVSVAFCALLLGPLLTDLPVREYFAASQTWNFLLGKGSLIGLLFTGGGSELPGLFQGNPLPGKVNGSLWTLPWEVLMYAGLAALGIAASTCRSRAMLAIGTWFLLIIAASMAVAFYTLPWLGTDSAAETSSGIGAAGGTVRIALRFSVLFISGAALESLSRIRARWGNGSPGSPREALITLGALGLAILGYTLHSGLYPLYLLCLPIAVIGIGETHYGRQLYVFNRYGDYSYGIYIFAFPVQQALVALEGPIGAGTLALLTFPTVALMAALSWHLIEKPCLRAKGALDGLRLTTFHRSDKPA
jgi:peptidoglycan/LPS O-acetylase OafA/YrhL